MFLKKIDFQGFKSFVDPTTMTFEPGISAVIGPNGCGKSNVSDAIRWVLGEQSAKALRGSKMVDVIFNGTDTRKPSGMAEVTLSIANEDRALPVDFAEVSVTRRSYRSGETEYLINKAPARLKDIFALFADTGIGTDGYSLLEQGKMDLILSSKPMDRRSVFEEAAGITKYKTQRDEALRKLEATEQNLLRVNDIVTEVKRQINSLERQAKKAERYNSLKGELDQLQSRLYVKEWRQSRSAVAELEKSLEGMREELQGLEAKMREADARLSQFRLDLAHDEEALSAATQKVYAIETEIAQVDRQIEINKAQVGNLEERAGRARDEAVQLRAKETAIAAETQSSRDAQQKERASLEALKAELHEADQSHRSASETRRQRSDQAQALQQRSIDLINRRSQVKAETESLHGKLSKVDERNLQLEQELIHAQGQLHDASQKLEEASSQAGAKGDEVKGLEETLGAKYLRRGEVEEAMRTAEEATNAAAMVVSSERARLGVLEELSRALEGFAAGPKAVLLASQKGEASLAGFESLASKVQAKAEAELAVELALGSRLQLLLCADHAQGLAALEWLRGSKQGRAAFIAKGSVKVAAFEFSSDVRSQDGVLGPLTSFMQAEPALRDVLHWLAGRVLLVRDLATATRVAPSLPAACEAVSLDGWQVTSEGVVRGGAVETAERGLLGREREMGELRRRIDDGQKQTVSLAADRDRLRKDLQGLATEIESQSAQKKDAEIQVARLQKEQHAKQEDFGRLTRESAEKRRAMEAVQVEGAGYRAGIENHDRQLREIAEQEAGLQGDLNRLLDEIDALRKREDELQQLLSTRRVAQASADQRLSNLGATLSRLELELAQSGEQAARREAEDKTASGEQEGLRQRNAVLEEALKQLFGRKDSASDDQRRRVEARQARAQAIVDVEDEVRRLRLETASRSEEKHQKEMTGHELKLRVDSLEQTLTSIYKLELDQLQQSRLDLAADGAETGGEEPSPERLEEVKRKLDELGVVNPAAADEYRELEQRHSMLVGQLEDLKSAKSDLMKVVHRINQESRDRFLETFEKVHENFRRIYRSLFGGGEAKLVLSEEGDLLEAGIDIIARPPGKRQQTISLLSGGERALTAIALLFALFECKPSPFCVLDEIDAPLDDANISRFTKILGEYAAKSQFIVITHSKLTMEKADVLYGITMEEAGVSRIISAKFKDDKPVVAG